MVDVPGRQSGDRDGCDGDHRGFGHGDDRSPRSLVFGGVEQVVE
jgi:hypothetical protein